ncbi:hypothetical protein GUJ93_ZPchr0002g25200 [Zizania palustris]|uniref:Uncharacterized protein n=1 Tax=Zizania palustris TaxID=103762 RepID=A0A8J5V508_ZIZPA|nr:hypothetical protein GUJ93_ZPchr0002g25200 [Zizania palustris]
MTCRVLTLRKKKSHSTSSTSTRRISNPWSPRLGPKRTVRWLRAFPQNLPWRWSWRYLPPPQSPPPAPMEDVGQVNLILPIHLPAAQDPPQAPPQPLRPPIRLVYSRRPKAAGPSTSAPVVLPSQPTPVATGVPRKDKTPFSDKDLRRSLRLKIKSLGFKRNIHSAKAGPSIQDFPAIEDFINISSHGRAAISTRARGLAPPPPRCFPKPNESAGAASRPHESTTTAARRFCQGS